MTKVKMKAGTAALMLAVFGGISACGGGAGSAGAGGRGGSTARFALLGDRLYTVNQSYLNIFDVTDPGSPQAVRRFDHGWTELETIFSNGQHLFVGTPDAMLIYGVDDPDSPAMISEMTHGRGCDPVVTSGDKAYITVRSSGFRCVGSATDELKIVDISNPAAPALLSSTPMNAPWGLGVSGDRAYVCDGSMGLRILDVADAQKVEFLAGLSEEICMDVIPTASTLIVTGLTGINQYDVSTLPPVKLSNIPATDQTPPADATDRPQRRP